MTNRPLPRVSGAPGYPTEAADGTPHLTYYAEGVSFVWSGDTDHPIQVCPGGYGEPVQHTIPTDVPALDQSIYMPAWRYMQAFQRVCDQWLEHPPRPTWDLPMGGCSTSAAHYAHLEAGSTVCENQR